MLFTFGFEELNTDPVVDVGIPLQEVFECKISHNDLLVFFERVVDIFVGQNDGALGGVDAGPDHGVELEGVALE